MSPIQPQHGPVFDQALLRLVQGKDPADLQQAIYIAANNAYPRFERQGALLFGWLDGTTNRDWKSRETIYFCFAMRWGMFNFIDAREKDFTQSDKVELARIFDGFLKDQKGK